MTAQDERPLQAEKAHQERRDATHLMCVVMSTLISVDPTEWAAKYEPSEALPDSPVDLAVIDAALASLKRLRAAWVAHQVITVPPLSR